MTGIQATLGSSPHTRGALSAASFNTPKTRDHPRIRGEHRLYLCNRWNNHGIIPAYAGSTTSLSSKLLVSLGSSPHTRGAPQRFRTSSLLERDHPRIRGEHPLGDAVRVMGRGIIPAYAGSTAATTCALVGATGSSPHTRGAPFLRSPLKSLPGDHPRIRGEHFREVARERLRAGIIPAYAGSTRTLAIGLSWLMGSSPHTRGAPR